MGKVSDGVREQKGSILGSGEGRQQGGHTPEYAPRPLRLAAVAGSWEPAGALSSKIWKPPLLLLVAPAVGPAAGTVLRTEPRLSRLHAISSN